MPGLYCEEGSSDPLTVCSAGSFCPNSSTQLPCPKHFFCRAASVEPRKCAFFSYCPVGTEVPIQVWVGLFLAILLLTILAIIRRSRVCIRRTIKRVLRMAACIAKSPSSASHGDGEDEPHKPAPRVAPAIPSPKFSIALRNLQLQKGSNKILNGIDVKLKSGVIMIQGTSGCGKSTLIKCMSGKTQNELSSLTGSITFSDGGEASEGERTSSVHAFPQNPLNTPGQRATWEAFQSHVGFVPQDDVVHEDLNVKDNIAFSIKLRRPGLTARQQEALLEEMLTELQLTKQSRNLITNISGQCHPETAFVQTTNRSKRRFCRTEADVIFLVFHPVPV
jgi:ABC-type polar amino acid transport system ATPase subunit